MILEPLSPAATCSDCSGQAPVDSLTLGVVVYDNSLEGDGLMAQVADSLSARGYHLGGVVQANVHRPGRRKCDMYLQNLLNGEQVLISLDRGNEARGCRLDADAFSRINAWGEQALATGVDLVLINKFGKEEAQGRGLRSLIAEALGGGTPVVLGVSALNLPDLETFAGGPVHRLPAQHDEILAWCRAAIASARE